MPVDPVAPFTSGSDSRFSAGSSSPHPTLEARLAGPEQRTLDLEANVELQGTHFAAINSFLHGLNNSAQACSLHLLLAYLMAFEMPPAEPCVVPLAETSFGGFLLFLQPELHWRARVPLWLDSLPQDFEHPRSHDSVENACTRSYESILCNPPLQGGENAPGVYSKRKPGPGVIAVFPGRTVATCSTRTETLAPRVFPK